MAWKALASPAKPPPTTASVFLPQALAIPSKNAGGSGCNTCKVACVTEGSNASSVTENRKTTTLLLWCVFFCLFCVELPPRRAWPVSPRGHGHWNSSRSKTACVPTKGVMEHVQLRGALSCLGGVGCSHVAAAPPVGMGERGRNPLAGGCLLPPAGYAVVGALLRCPLPLDLLRSLLVVVSPLPVVPIRRLARYMLCSSLFSLELERPVCCMFGAVGLISGAPTRCPGPPGGGGCMLQSLPTDRRSIALGGTRAIPHSWGFVHLGAQLQCVIYCYTLYTILHYALYTVHYTLLRMQRRLRVPTCLGLGGEDLRLLRGKFLVREYALGA
jgi:hypothetical protein